MGTEIRLAEGTGQSAARAALRGILGIVESWRHRRAVQSIPIRIHVAGSRDTSGVTRLIAAGLRAGGLRAFAKTTGTLPRMIGPDGNEQPITRRGQIAAVTEQVQAVREAVREKVDVLIIEGLDTKRSVESQCEQKLVRATHAVITNIRSGEGNTDRVASTSHTLATFVPQSGRLYTAEQVHLARLHNAAMDRDTELVCVDDDEIAQVTWDELEQFPYVAHPENVALALRVCIDLGVPRETALRGMHEAHPDPGVMTVYPCTHADGELIFINGFAANDSQSTCQLWDSVVPRYGATRRRIAVINCHADRADGLHHLAEAIARWTEADHYVLIGSGTHRFAQSAIGAGMKPSRFTCLEQVGFRRVVQTLQQLAGTSALILGLGHLNGPGHALVRHYREHLQREAKNDSTSSDSNVTANRRESVLRRPGLRRAA
jgi:poly-gamma-glutamate synthase PgsB/CapB